MKAVFAYPHKPPAIGQCIRSACQRLRQSEHWQIIPWEEVDNWGRPLIAPILTEISDSNVLFADITRLNFNVTYEMGYAIGSKRRLLPVINRGLVTHEDQFSSIGVYDSLGYKFYENTDGLVELLQKPITFDPISFSSFRDLNAPIFLLETPFRSDDLGRIVARIKKSRLRYRSFTRSEDTRLSGVYAIDQVARSFAVVVPLSTDDRANAFEHNLKAAFVAGLARGLGIRSLILQPRGGPAPADVKDDVITYRELDDIDEHINELCYDTHALLHSRQPDRASTSNILASLSIGDPTAENEFATLGNYYIRTDEFHRTRRGEANLVTGRKGTGKTALFAQIRDEVRRNVQNVVVDLKPEGYQLIKLKESILRALEQGSKEHLITAFWEYLLYMEIAAKLLEKDHDRHYRDHETFERYERLRAVYETDRDLAIKGDFSERLNSLSDAMARRFEKMFPRQIASLTNGQITEIIHCHEITRLRSLLEDYLKTKNEVWLLFDNLDKGWTPGGITETDILILRCLLDAVRKVRNDLHRQASFFKGVIFVRNDVYQILLSESPDFGKNSRANLDWRDKELLRRVLVERIAEGLRQEGLGADDALASVCVTHVSGVEVIDLLMRMSLLRPRNLIKAFNYSRGVAVNRGHKRIEEEDIREGIRILSEDIFVDCNNEIRDVLPEGADILYEFVGQRRVFTRDDVQLLAIDHGVSEENLDSLVDHLLYYGALGIQANEADATFIYDVNYDLKRLQMFRQKFPSHRYVLHPVLYPVLGISESVADLNQPQFWT